MSHIPGQRPKDAKPIKEERINLPILTLVNGPYSFMMWDRLAKDPDDPSVNITVATSMCYAWKTGRLKNIGMKR
jgi:hypothetical protein